jgi:hypothetical protein
MKFIALYATCKLSAMFGRASHAAEIYNVQSHIAYFVNGYHKRNGGGRRRGKGGE